MARTISSPGAPSSDALNFFSSPAPPPRPSHAPSRNLFDQRQLPPLHQQTSIGPPLESDDQPGMDAQDLPSAMVIESETASSAAHAQPSEGGEQLAALLPRRIILKRSAASAAATAESLATRSEEGDDAAGDDAQGETDDDDAPGADCEEEDTPAVEFGRGHIDDGDGDGQATTDADGNGDDDSGESEIEVQSRPVAPAVNGRRVSARRSTTSYAEADDDDDDDGAVDTSLAFLTSASPRISRSGRVSKPPAHLAKQVTSMNFTDEEMDEDDEPQPKRNRKGKDKRASDFISKNEDLPEWDSISHDEQGRPGTSSRPRRSSSKSGGFQPTANRPVRSTRATSQQSTTQLRAQAPTRAAVKQQPVPKGIITSNRRGLRSTGPAVDPEILRLADQLPAGFDGSDGVLGGGAGPASGSGAVDGAANGGPQGDFDESGDEEFHVEEIADDTEEGDEDDEDEDDHPVRNPGQRVLRGANQKPAGRATRNSRRAVSVSEGESSSQQNQRSLRERKNRPNYQLIPPTDQQTASRASPRKKKSSASAYGTVVGGGRKSGSGYNRIPWGSSGKELGKYMGLQEEGDSSDDDFVKGAAAKAAAAGGGASMFGAGAGGGLFNPAMPMDMAGGPSNMGKVGDASLSDADPLGINTKITFEDVGGLDQHIQQLKEMVSLPLLYPEVFQQFNVTPPRGVLFHGPPGTGKTLVARALAASCSSTGTKISFFMRKGADCLSKWVGEAERQLRLLFEEAKACQPSIIFFDEIDGLAPVRSSKQDQIHASIVSTLLALMDGMDGRGQVIIIGATNRPDAVDPALRRPGRFDREFFFPLPNKTARRKILEINTKTWEPTLAGPLLDNLADITKGYGGADLRALCTEASLNAIQRRYPQIYKTNERLLLQPDSIHVQAKDFMVSVKNLIPSSARSTASAAAPLPQHLAPLLADALKRTTAAIDRALPPTKKRSVLEDAEWETDDPAEGSYERELRLQEFEASRVYRPRLIIHGDEGFGQSYLASAVLHHLEGFHVQSMDLATLLGDSTRTLEAAIVQLFIEAKRHKPAVLFIPSLTQWVNTVTETARSTFKSLLDSLAPSDPVLLLAVVDGQVADIPRDVKAWFGHAKENRVALTLPSLDQRAEFFNSVLELVRTPPSELPDAAPKRRRILEVLPLAPPPPPRKPSPAELALQEENDGRLREHLKWRLGPVLNELKRKHKRFTKPVEEEFDMYLEYRKEVIEDHEAAANSHDPIAISDDDGHSAYAPDKEPLRPIPPMPIDINLEQIHSKLYYDRYLTVEAFLADMHVFVENAHLDPGHTDRVLRSQQLLNHAQLLVDQSCDAQFRHECGRMAEREIDRRKAKAEAAKEQAEEASRTEKKGKGRELGDGPSDIRGSRYSHRVRGVPAEGLVQPMDNPEASLKRSRGVSLDVAGSVEPIRNGVDSMEVDGQLPPTKKSRADDNGIGVTGLHATTSLDSNPSTVLVLESPVKPTTDDPIASSSAFHPSQTTPRHQMSHRSMSIMDLCSPSETGGVAIGPNGLPAVDDLSTPRPVGALVRPASDQGSPIKALGATLHAPFAIGLPPSSPDKSRSTAVERDLPLVVLDPSPPFELPLSTFSALERTISDRTASFNIEQLEQLRALLSDAIWRRRADWNRTALVDELATVLADFVRGVEGEDDW